MKWNQKLIDTISYITMFLMVIIIFLMWTHQFPMDYAYLAIFFASIVLILRLGNRIYNLLNKKK
ncbi:MAG: hypothetical protein WHV63_08365 [Ignavibacteria bacterium]|jgi:TRAP-type C4-dicarboxylate transport system permease small subunit